MHHPWRAFREQSHYTLEFDLLPAGVLAWTNHLTRCVTMAPNLDQTERRCSIEHERQHILDPDASEDLVRYRTAHILLPDIDAIGDALCWEPDLESAADELWVDVDVLTERIQTAHPSERAYLKRRLAEDGR